MQNCFSYVSLVDLLIVLPHMFSLITLCLRADLHSVHASRYTHANVKVVINVLVVVYWIKVRESGYAIPSWSADTGYLTFGLRC